MQIALSSDERFLELTFPAPMRTASWAILGGGLAQHRRVVFHFVRREELGEDVDARELLRTRLAERGSAGALGFLTARHLAPFADVSCEVAGVTARAIVTAGLGNALRVGDPPASERVGTINVLAVLSAPLDPCGLLEALALASEARTAALLTLDVKSVQSGLPASGTGTDCIAVACPCEGLRHSYAGKHTALGSALGRAVHDATLRACLGWQDDPRRHL